MNYKCTTAFVSAEGKTFVRNEAISETMWRKLRFSERRNFEEIKDSSSSRYSSVSDDSYSGNSYSPLPDFGTDWGGSSDSGSSGGDFGGGDFGGGGSGGDW